MTYKDFSVYFFKIQSFIVANEMLLLMLQAV